MSYTGKLRRFLLFASPTKNDRKVFMGSFVSRADAIELGEMKKSFPTAGPGMRWQVIDNDTNEVVAEDPGG